MAKELVWEKINGDSDIFGQLYTERASVPGGWLVRVIVYAENYLPGNAPIISSSISFVPEDNISWA